VIPYCSQRLIHQEVGHNAMAREYPVKPPAAMGEIYQIPCRHCGGSGQEPTLPDLTCRECMGRGRRKWRIEECETCRGRGTSLKTLGLLKCRDCRGQGWQARDIG
jgi:DnaJ-class molecular chaperone